MKILLFLLALCYLQVHHAHVRSKLNFDIITGSTYYDLSSRLPLPVKSIENNLQISSDFYKTGLVRRVGFRRNGCTCQTLTCGCCVGFNFPQFNFNREGCMNFTYNPNEFSITSTMLFNGNSVFTNTISAKNPPPACIPVPIPYLPSVDFCVRLFDIHTPGQNLHMCVDFETRIQRATVLVLHFDCIRMGNDGVALVKPGATLSPSTSTDSQIDSDVFDEITEVKVKKNLGSSKL
ncbi:uncharacterized protein LOC108738211 [Agrilus planipennis]|uniref:Uncharacterized protein LOC108738211 n=1 Tax=Agrilus planipennis TaxID=224129 RepID=A0A1W4X2K0_AGRPL|nr:uncharacterized protein LOC108738211 [Agrilus planipennis]